MNELSDIVLINKKFKEKIEKTRCPKKKEKLLKSYKKAIDRFEENSIKTFTFVGQLQ